MGNIPKVWGENTKYLSCHHLGNYGELWNLVP